MSVFADTNPKNRCYTTGTWRGKQLAVGEGYPGVAPCPIGEHRLYPVTHYGDLGTGFLMCHGCGGVANDPDPDWTVENYKGPTL